MKIPQRLEHALAQLYTAFHSDELNPECCKQCAVGNILGNRDMWKHLSEGPGTLRLTYVGLVHQRLGRRFQGYTPEELLRIEAVFLEACGYELPFGPNTHKPLDPSNKEMLFNGLCAVVTFLCSLDGVEDVTDYARLFEYEGTAPKHELAL